MPKLFQYINYIDYNELIHKPIINGVILEGKLSLEDLGIQPAGSYAHLVNGKVPLEELPDDVFGQLQYQGIWNAELNEPLLPNIPEVKGQYWIVANGGTRFGQDWEKGDWIIAGESVWQKIDNSDIVTSVNGMIGDIELDASNIPYDTTKSIKEAIDQEHQDFSGDIAQLRADLTTEVSRATSAEDDLDDKINAEITNRTQADTTLQTSITTETTRASTAEGVLDTRITHEIQDRTNADNAFQSALENVIDGLNTEISARVKEVQDRKDADNVLQTNITAEETRAKGVEHTLQDNIDAEELRATTAEGTLQSAIDSEVAARQTADTTLQTNITAEVTRATDVENQLRTDLTAETNRATSAEEELENKKADKSDTYTKAEIDGKLSGGMHFKGTVPTYNELPNNPEVGDMYNVLDTGANYAWNGTMWDKLSENIDLSNYATITYVDGKLSDEVAARQTADTTLQTNITAEVTRATGVENQLRTDLTAETNRATSAEGTLQSNITAEESRAKGVEGQLRTDLTAEITRATTAEGTLQDNIDAEILDRQSADTTLQTSITTINTKVDGEIQNRIDADTTLTTNLNKEIQDRKDADRSLQESITQEISDRTHSDELLSTNLSNEVSRATTAEGTLTTNLSNEVTRATNAETALQTSITSLDSRIDDLEDDIATDISTAINQVKADLTTEVSRATTAEGTLQSNITAEETRAKLAEKDLQTNLTLETNRATTAENTLSNSIQALDDRIQNNITTAIQEIQNDLDQEIQDRIDGDNSIQTDLDTFKTTVYTKDEVDAKMSSLFEYKGCVHTIDELPTTGNKIGDVYNVEDTGSNYAWNGQTWDKLSEDIDLSGLLTKEEAEEIFASKNDLEALDDKYVLKSGDTMSGSLTINGSMSGALNTNATITAGNNETVYEASLKSIRKCENDSNRVNESKTYVLSSGEAIISHNRGQEDSYIMFDATKLKYGTGEQNGSRVSNVYDIMTSKDTFTKEEVQQLFAQFLIDLNMSQYATKEDLNNVTRTFVYTQAHAIDTWVINHNLNNYPSVVIVDDNGNQLTGSVWYADKNNITITFSQPFAGRAYLN